MKDRHPPRHSRAAEGKTVVAIGRAIRRVDAGSIKVEVVRGSCGITTRRPIVAVDASVQESNTATTWQVNVPAAHEVSPSSSQSKDGP